MLRVVKGLVKECDVVVDRLLDGWKEERAVDKLVCILIYDSDQLSLIIILQMNDISNAPPLNPIPPPSSGRTHAPLEDELVDPREIDKLLNELSALCLRFAVFQRFIVTNFEVCVRVDLIRVI